jgi:hypothetical protein
MLKQCTKCKILKQETEFGLDNKGKKNLKSVCKLCRSILEQNSSYKYQHSIKGLFRMYKYSSQLRNLSFNLTLEEFAEIISVPCYYCGELQKAFNGVDRVNNNEGYTLKNCVSCCKMCNQLKRAYSRESFIHRCSLITEKQGGMPLL